MVAAVKRGLDAGEEPHIETSISGADVRVGEPEQASDKE